MKYSIKRAFMFTFRNYEYLTCLPSSGNSLQIYRGGNLNHANEIFIHVDMLWLCDLLPSNIELLTLITFLFTTISIELVLPRKVSASLARNVIIFIAAQETQRKAREN